MLLHQQEINHGETTILPQHPNFKEHIKPPSNLAFKRLPLTRPQKSEAPKQCEQIFSLIIAPEAVITTLCGRDAAVELIGLYSQRVWITASGAIPAITVVPCS
jgi:hypothetical protein